MKEIYLAGGCFWGVEKYLSLVEGVMSTSAGYANGDSENTDYASVCAGSGHTEAVRVVYNQSVVSLEKLLDIYYECIDPFSVNRQGNDCGIQYRSGIYYKDPDDAIIVAASLDSLSDKLGGKVALEHGPLVNWCEAEDYHQKYLDRNPRGYCHIPPRLFEYARWANTGGKRQMP